MIVEMVSVELVLDTGYPPWARSVWGILNLGVGCSLGWLLGRICRFLTLSRTVVLASQCYTWFKLLQRLSS